MKVIAVQSAVVQGSVALYEDETGYNRIMEMPLTGKLSTALAPAIDSILKEAGWDYPDIGLFTCAAGPGSFTGLRVGMAIGKGISIAVGCAMKAVPTLDIIWYDYCGSAHSVIAVIDARSDRVYYAEYSEMTDSSYLTSSEPRLVSVKGLLELSDGVEAVIGPDIGSLSSIFEINETQTVEVYPSALTLAKIGNARYKAFGGDKPAGIVPLYLKSGQV